MSQVLHAYGEPSTWSTVRAQGLEKDLAKLGPSILEAAERNGVDSKTVLDRARIKVLGKYYSDFFKALNNDEPKKMEMRAESIIRMGGTLQGLYASMSRRDKAQKKVADPEKSAKVAEAFNKARRTLE
jgi:hypothetical protein